MSYTSLAPPYRQNLHRYLFFGWQVEIVYFENRIMAITKLELWIVSDFWLVWLGKSCRVAH